MGSPQCPLALAMELRATSSGPPHSPFGSISATDTEQSIHIHAKSMRKKDIHPDSLMLKGRRRGKAVDETMHGPPPPSLGCSMPGSGARNAREQRHCLDLQRRSQGMGLWEHSTDPGSVLAAKDPCRPGNHVLFLMTLSPKENLQ